MINLDKLKRQYQKKITSAKTSKQLEAVRISILGRNGQINNLFSKISKETNLEKRKQIGQKLNQIKSLAEQLIKSQAQKVADSRDRLKSAKDQSFSLKKFGHLHPITLTVERINEIFSKMGFSIYDGPEIETDEYCFKRLNVPENHPARDLQDTIYIKKPEILLRTQTSSIEAHLLEDEKPPFRAAFPGKTYRNEKVNKSNHFVFHQYQGVAVDKNISLKDLIGVLNRLFNNLYGDVAARYRCKYYPEVEPGLGLDLQCFNCCGKGCALCKGVGWIEMGGAGIIHPKVMTYAGLDPKVWRGFAFGLGLDRWVMAKYKINDIRTLLGGNLAYKPNQP